MQPRQYSMVWMAWCINTSAVSNTCNKHSFIIYTRTTIVTLQPHELSNAGFLFLTSSASACSSTSPWRVLMFPSSVTSGCLSSSWHHREPEIYQKTHQIVGRGSVQRNYKLTTWYRLYLNVTYWHMGFPNSRNGTEHSASTTRTFCTTTYMWRMTTAVSGLNWRSEML